MAVTVSITVARDQRDELVAAIGKLDPEDATVVDNSCLPSGEIYLLIRSASAGQAAAARAAEIIAAARDAAGVTFMAIVGPAVPWPPPPRFPCPVAGCSGTFAAPVEHHGHGEQQDKREARCNGRESHKVERIGDAPWQATIWRPD